MADSLIHLEGVTKVFYTDEVETHALAGIHLDLNKGEYVSISGPSGCGKSTLLSILGLLDTPTSGTYILNGQSVANLNLSQRARIRNREVGFIERRAPAHLPRDAFRGKEEARERCSRAGGNGASDQAFPVPALGRPAAEGGRGPGRGR
jgi:ABC-type glutathione transport system ATPase component